MEKKLKLIALQILYLFEQNEVGLLLPNKEVNLLSSNYIKMRLLLSKIVDAAKVGGFIEKKVTLWEFVELIRESFLLAFKDRTAALKEQNYPHDFKFDYPHEEFLLTNGFTVTQEMIQKELPPVKPLDAGDVSGSRISFAERNDDNIEMYRQVED